jgi:hypothetical protein
VDVRAFVFEIHSARAERNRSNLALNDENFEGVC